MYNKITILGRLTKDIELRYTQSGVAIGKSSIASSHQYKDKTTGEKKEEVMFIDIAFFGRSAEVANQYLKKGDLVLIDGRLTLNQWVGNDGSKRQKHEVVVEELKMLPKGDNSQQNQLTQPQTVSQSQQTQNQNNIPSIDIDDEEIPF